VLARTSRTRRNVAMIYACKPPANARRAIHRLPTRCLIGHHSGTQPLVNSMHSIAQLRRVSLPSLSVVLMSTSGDSKELKAKISLFPSVSVGVVASKMARVQSATPNPSIEGMPKRLRLLCTPHVKR
jgi:hypothetical protein